MIPEKGSLFLCDWSKIKEKHCVNTNNINHCFRARDRVTVEVTYIATQEEGKFACMKKEQDSL